MSWRKRERVNGESEARKDGDEVLVVRWEVPRAATRPRGGARWRSDARFGLAGAAAGAAGDARFG